MRQLDSCVELYNEIIKSFLSGKKKKDERFFTQSELRDWSGLSKRSVEKVFSQLKKDGFIHTDGSRGTRVTFDSQNPEHLAKVPYCRSNPAEKDFVHYICPLQLFTFFITKGLQYSDTVRIVGYRRAVSCILDELRRGHFPYLITARLIRNLVGAIHNTYLDTIANHFFYRYFNLTPDTCDTAGYQTLCRESERYYTALSKALKARDYSGISALVSSHFNNLYEIPNLFLFSLDDVKFDPISDQVLYGQLLRDLLVKIMISKMKPGDPLPTEKELCHLHGVGRNTVRRAYQILERMELVQRKEGVGTILVASTDSEVLEHWLQRETQQQKQNMLEAMNALMLVVQDVCELMEFPPSKTLLDQVEQELNLQYANYLQIGAPFTVPDVFFNQIVAAYPDSIVQNYYFYISSQVSEYRALYFVRLCRRNPISDAVYKHMSKALEALRQEDRATFTDQLLRAQLMSAKRLNALHMEQLTHTEGSA